MGAHPRTHGAHGLGIRRTVVPVSLELAAEQVAGGQQGIHHGGVQRHFAAAGAVEQRLEKMGNLGQVVVAEGCRTALDGMRGAEDGVELLVRGVRRIDAHEQHFHRLEMLRGFLEEDAAKRREVDTRGCKRVGVHENPDQQSAEYAPDDLEQTIGIERLDQPAGGAGRAALGLHFVAELRRQHEDRNTRVLGCGPQ